MTEKGSLNDATGIANSGSHIPFEKRRVSPEGIYRPPSPEYSADDAQNSAPMVPHDEFETTTSSSFRTKSFSRWDAVVSSEAPSKDTNVVPKQPKTRWDEVPGQAESSLPSGSAAATDLLFPLSSDLHYLPEEIERNKFMTDTEILDMLPSEGYVTIPAPASYISISPRRLGTDYRNAPLPSQSPTNNILYELESIEQGDPIFEQLDVAADQSQLSIAQMKQQKLLKLLFNVKKGPNQAKNQAIRQLVNKSAEFGAASMFDSLLPLLSNPAINFLERHSLIKLVNRLILKFGHECRPYVQKLITVVSPLLADTDFHVRVEGREVLSNLAKSVGNSAMIAALRPSMEDQNDYLRNSAARCFAIVASSLGVSGIVPFLKAACQSKNWVIRHTSIKIVQQIAITQGAGVLPYLRSLIACIQTCLEDSNMKIRNMTALAIAALAESSYPYGLESFKAIIDPLWNHSHKLRGKSLAAAIKAMGSLLILMVPTKAKPYAKDMMPVLFKALASTDEEEKRIALQATSHILRMRALDKTEARNEVLPNIFKAFWNKHSIPDRRGISALMDSMVLLAEIAGIEGPLSRLATILNDDTEILRRAATEAIHQICRKCGTSEIGKALETQLINGLLFVFQEHSGDDASNVLIKSIGTTLNQFGKRLRPYLGQLFSLIFWHLTHKSPKVRQFAAEAAYYVLDVIKGPEEQELLGKLALVLYENLGEEYPEVLASIILTLKGIFGDEHLNLQRPTPKELLLRLTPILRNRNERVQENCVTLIGTLAKLDIAIVSAKEWMRICFELLDLLKSPRKVVRRAAILTFGMVARAVGPHDVMAALLNNLKVQERTNRVATTLAIAIVAESCGPFTILPALMNEYRVPEMNVQNGVLKSIAFMFEFIGELSKDYIYALVSLLDDALQDRDQVHRQAAAIAVKHLSIAVIGYGCEDALIHLLNAILPNVFDANSHLILALFESLDAIRLAVSPSVTLAYIVQGLFHPARRVRTIFWKLFNDLYIGSNDSLTFAIPYSYSANLPDRCLALDLVI